MSSRSRVAQFQLELARLAEEDEANEKLRLTRRSVAQLLEVEAEFLIDRALSSVQALSSALPTIHFAPLAFQPEIVSLSFSEKEKFLVACDAYGNTYQKLPGRGFVDIGRKRVASVLTSDSGNVWTATIRACETKFACDTVPMRRLPGLLIDWSCDREGRNFIMLLELADSKWLTVVLRGEATSYPCDAQASCVTCWVFVGANLFLGVGDSLVFYSILGKTLTPKKSIPLPEPITFVREYMALLVVKFASDSFGVIDHGDLVYRGALPSGTRCIELVGHGYLIAATADCVFLVEYPLQTFRPLARPELLL